MWERSPRAPVANEIKKGIENFAPILCARMSTRFGWRNQGFEDAPFSIRQVTRVGFSIHRSFGRYGELFLCCRAGEEAEDNHDFCASMIPLLIHPLRGCIKRPEKLI